MPGRAIIRLMLALTILVSAFLRPPGTMLVLDGDTVTYGICTGGELETVKVALGDEHPEEIDIGCDFFAAQMGALPLHSVSVTPTSVEASGLVALGRADVFLVQTHRSFNAPRAPPVPS